MIQCIGYDVEVFRNYFSVTFISINDYLKIFNDIRNNKNKPIPLVQKLTVAEIEERLSRVKTWQFHITDTDDSQLLPMISFINSLHPIKQDNIATRYDLYGYNSFNYDKLMIACLLMNYNQCETTRELILRLYETSKKIINRNNSKDGYDKNDFYLNTLKQYKLPYQDVDVMRIFALNKVAKGVDKTTGETINVPKGLKQTSINLQWYQLLEYTMPPICDKDIKLYDCKEFAGCRGYTAEQLNKLIDVWDRFMIDEYIPDVLHYNKNDVFIVCEIVRLFSDEIKSRYSISSVYNVDVLNSSRSQTADIIFEKLYSKFSGLAPEDWKGKSTERTAMSFKRVIFPNIRFQTAEMQSFLADLKKVVLYRIGKDAFEKTVKIGKTEYTMATGGLHSKDRPMEVWSTTDYEVGAPASSSLTGGDSDEKYTIFHRDVASFYPSIMCEYQVAPGHMVASAFANMVRYMRDTRVKAKHSTEELVDGIPKDILANVLKIVINSIYGKFGFEKGNLYDRLAVLKVTINGQLMLLMLCEALNLAGIEVISANTDGIMVKVKNKDLTKFKEIGDWWQNETKMKFDDDVLQCLIARDINNYEALFRVKDKKTGNNALKIEYKGDFNPSAYIDDLKKGYDAPIVAQAVENYFLYKKPVMKTFEESTNILDFCKTQNVGRQFHVEEEYIMGGKVIRNILQRENRYYVSNKGKTLWKVSNNDSLNSSRLSAGNVVTVLNTLDDSPIVNRDINYRYYYNEAMKIINPIKLGISPKGKGKTQCRKQYGMYNSLFDEEEFYE